MKKLNDDALQELLSNNPSSNEDNLSVKDADNLLAYQNLFKILETEPAQGLSFSFASNVRRKLQGRLNRKSDMRFNMMAASIFILCLLLGYGLLQLISQTAADLVWSMVLEFKWLLLSLTCLFFGILLTDQQLTKREY